MESFMFSVSWQRVLLALRPLLTPPLLPHHRQHTGHLLRGHFPIHHHFHRVVLRNLRGRLREVPWKLEQQCPVHPHHLLLLLPPPPQHHRPVENKQAKIVVSIRKKKGAVGYGWENIQTFLTYFLFVFALIIRIFVVIIIILIRSIISIVILSEIGRKAIDSVRKMRIHRLGRQSPRSAHNTKRLNYLLFFGIFIPQVHFRFIVVCFFLIFILKTIKGQRDL